MQKDEMRKVENYFEAFIIIFFLLLFFLLIKSYFMPLLLAATFVFLTRKRYLKLLKKTRSEAVSATILLIFVLVVILLPVYLISVSLVNEATNLISFGNDALNSGKLNDCSFDICRTIENNVALLNSGLANIFTTVAQKLSSSVDVIFSSISRFIIGFAIFVAAFYFLQVDGSKFVRYVRRLIPMKNEYKDALFLKFRDVTSAVFVDSLLVSVLQGTLVGLGFWAVGVGSPVFWGVISAFFSLIPMVGTSIVWVPVVLYFFLTGSLIKGIFLLIYGVVIVGLSDNIVRPYLLRNKVKVHPFLILLSIMGGLELFGFLGIFLGPIIISLLVAVLQLYKLDFK